MSDDKEHAKYSASGSERWLNCPGSIRLESEIEKEEDSVYAQEGTKAHDLLASWLESSKRNKRFIPKKFDKDMVKPVSQAVLIVRDRVKDLSTLQIEAKISLRHIHDQMWGTADIIDPDLFGTLKVYDYKHGVGHVVQVHNKKGHLNTQLAFYGLAAAHEHYYNFQNLELGIIQPRAYHAKGPFRSTQTSMKQIKRYGDLFKRGVDRCEKRNAKLFAGSWCWFCKANRICPEKNKASISEARRELQ